MDKIEKLGNDICQSIEKKLASRFLELPEHKAKKIADAVASQLEKLLRQETKKD